MNLWDAKIVGLLDAHISLGGHWESDNECPGRFIRISPHQEYPGSDGSLFWDGARWNFKTLYRPMQANYWEIVEKSLGEDFHAPDFSGLPDQILKSYAGATKDNQSMNEQLIIYTDGACSGNGKEGARGGWAWCAVYPDPVNSERIPGIKTTRGEGSGSAPDTTNNRMEMTAAIEALSWLLREGPFTDFSVIVRSDSQYLVDGMNHWRFGWAERGWKTATGDDVKNLDLWRRLDALDRAVMPAWEWVKGHGSDYWNGCVDRMAREASQGVQTVD